MRIKLHQLHALLRVWSELSRQVNDVVLQLVVFEQPQYSAYIHG